MNTFGQDYGQKAGVFRNCTSHLTTQGKPPLLAKILCALNKEFEHVAQVDALYAVTLTLEVVSQLATFKCPEWARLGTRCLGHL